MNPHVIVGAIVAFAAIALAANLWLALTTDYGILED